MRNIIIVLWLILAGFFVSPAVSCFISGTSYDNVEDVIRAEAETDDIQITAEEEHGNKAMYCFNTGNDFGIAVFNHYADNYSSEEGVMANGEEYIGVRLDTGKDISRYNVTDNGAEFTGKDSFEGSYRTYGIIAAILAVFTIIAAVYGMTAGKKNRNKENVPRLR